MQTHLVNADSDELLTQMPLREPVSPETLVRQYEALLGQLPVGVVIFECTAERPRPVTANDVAVAYFGSPGDPSGSLAAIAEGLAMSGGLSSVLLAALHRDVVCKEHMVATGQMAAGRHVDMTAIPVDGNCVAVILEDSAGR